MAEKLLMLALSPTMETGQIVKWLKKEGDSIQSGDLICEVETDKAVMDYESPLDGVLLKISVPEGASVSVGETIGYVGEQGESIGEEEPAEKPSPQQDSIKIQEVEPPPVSKTPIKEITQKETPSSKPSETLKEAGSAVDIHTKQEEDGGDRVKSSPLARKIAQESQIDLELIKGSGPDGRVIKRDVLKYMDSGKPADSGADSGKKLLQIKEPAFAQKDTPLNDMDTQKAGSYAGSNNDKIVPLSGKRKIIARRLSDSMFSAPHYYLTLSVVMDSMIKARNSLIKTTGEKISFNSYFIKFAAMALSKHPVINSQWNEDSIIMHGNIDVGLAVALPDGLIVPVLRNCDGKGIRQIDHEMKQLVDKARQGALKPEEYKGATFTISNLGAYGIEEFTAVINPPASAILAIGAVTEKLRVGSGDKIEVKKIIKMTLSCDHRVIDGAIGAAFLRDLADMMENPVKALY